MKSIALLSLFLLILHQPSWEFEEESNGIKAYSRLKNNTDYYEFKTEVNITSTAKKVVAIVTAIDDFQHWLTSTTHSEILKRESPTEFIGYTVTSTPWPLSSRDLVFRMKIVKQNTFSYRVQLTGIPSYIPKKKDYVRLKDYEAEWIIEESNGMTKVQHIASFDPDSSTPTWMVKNSMISARIEVLAALKKQF